MITEDEYNAIPPYATCEQCRHFATDPKSGATWCEYLARKVDRKKWCYGWEPDIMVKIRQMSKRVEKY